MIKLFCYLFSWSSISSLSSITYYPVLICTAYNHVHMNILYSMYCYYTFTYVNLITVYHCNLSKNHLCGGRIYRRAQVLYFFQFFCFLCYLTRTTLLLQFSTHFFCTLLDNYTCIVWWIDILLLSYKYVYIDYCFQLREMLRIFLKTKKFVTTSRQKLVNLLVKFISFCFKISLHLSYL